MNKLIFGLALALLLIIHNIDGAESKKYEPNWNSIDSRPLPSWFDQVKVGIFIHWGVFSVPSVGSGPAWFWWNWVNNKEPDLINFMNKNYRPNFTYGDFAPQFTAEFFDPDKWADLFKASGAKYIVLTSKHHEGFTMWPSKYSWNWNAMDVGPRRDLVGDLATAIRKKQDLRFGLYHSWYEWFNPLYLNDKANKYQTQVFIKQKTFPELLELVTKYKPEVIWSDGDWDAYDTYWNSTGFLAWLYNDSPVKDTVVVNDRWGIGTYCKHGGYWSCKDRYNPGVLQTHKWENAMTIDKVAWGFRRQSQLSDYMTTHELITTLAETVSCNGNILINVGPTHDGLITPVFEQRLRDLGHWLSINGQAIYYSKPWTYQNDTVTPNIWYTQRDGNVYATVLNWPQGESVTLGSVNSNKVSTIQMLGLSQNLKFSKSNSGTQVVFPQLTPNSNLKWAWVLKIKLNK